MNAEKQPEVVFALYRPHQEKFDALRRVLKAHVPTLQRLGMATARAPLFLRTRDGDVIEIFEWSDGTQAHRAQMHPEVAAIWEQIGACADLLKLGDLAEAREMFPHFRAFGV